MASFYPEESARVGYNVYIFRDILFDNYIQAKVIVSDIEKISNINLLNDKLTQIYKCSINSVIYSIMIVESFINDYLAAVLGDDNYYSRYDHLPVENKLNLCFDFIFEKKLKKDQGIIQLLKKINKIRNGYVHSKSKKIDSENCEYFKSLEPCEVKDTEYESMVNGIKKEIKQEYENIKESIKLIKQLAYEFDDNDSNVQAKSRLFGNIIERKIKGSVISKVAKDFKVDL